MEKVNIESSNLYITKLINVLKSSHIRSSKTLRVNGRYSDVFVYILNGSCKYVFDDKTSFTVNKGDILYLANKSVYEMFVGDGSYDVIFCDFEFSGDFPRKSDFFTPKSTSDAENLFKKLLRNQLHPDESSFFNSLSILYKIYAIIRESKSAQYVTKTTKQKMDEIKLYIDTNCHTDITILQLSEMMNVSEVYFRKVFKALYKISPAKYINFARIEKSKGILKYEFISLEECASLCGFSTVQYFCKTFKSIVGTTPAGYRKEINKR